MKITDAMWESNSNNNHAKHRYVTLFNDNINSSPPGRQNGLHYADDVFKCIFMNEKLRILGRISQKFVPKGPIGNKPTLF